MNRQQYWNNRRSFPPAELVKYRGQWVAFSLDGCRILAGAETLEGLHEKLDRLGQDLQAVCFESIPGPADAICIDSPETV